MADRMAEIRDLTADILSAEPEEVESAHSFIEELDADSLVAIELLTQLERKYGLEIPQESVQRMTNLKTTYEVVAEIAGW
ncbi:acyl carrier protein [Actinomadura sp. NEAU-AAG5]|uniref:Acyl carrier protein n=1 Tax=Actinomadura litoris TaxID=2678616 RepID=A0A7K1KXE4_9ACTN|nr:acyl carrier protein [Actinomadura litoris]